MIARIRSRALGGLLALGCLLIVGQPPSASALDIDPSRIPGVGSAEQIVLVTAPSARTSHATVRAYERTEAGWRTVLDATPARLGWSGMVRADRRRQATGKTPAGTFAITWAFGRAADPGTALTYQRVDRNDAWTYDPRVPSTYNLLQTAPTSWRSYGIYVEHLWRHGVDYDYVAVLDFNLPKGQITTDASGVRRASTPADTRRGGGIFLHVDGGGATAGCVAIPRSAMKAVLQWLDPARHPVIAIGTDAWAAGRHGD